MKKFSYFPPVTETDVAQKLNCSLKEVKKLKKTGVLDFRGKFICNHSLDEYFRGGGDFGSALSINLKRKIDEKIIEYHKDSAFQKKVRNQIIYSHNKGFINISYKSNKMAKPFNLYAIKKLEWTQKIKKATNDAFHNIKKDFVNKIAYQHYTSYVDARFINKKRSFISQIKKFGLVGFFNEYIDKELIELKKDESKILKLFNSLNDNKKENIKQINKLKSNIDICDRSIKFSEMIEFNKKRKSEYEVCLDELKANIDFEELDNIANQLNISYSITIWTRFKNELNKTNKNGYSNLVKEFNNRENDYVENNLLSKTDILDIVNKTKLLCGLRTLNSFEEAINEMNNYIEWSFNI